MLVLKQITNKRNVLTIKHIDKDSPQQPNKQVNKSSKNCIIKKLYLHLHNLYKLELHNNLTLKFKPPIMKKTNFLWPAIMVIIAVLFTTSCDKTITSTPLSIDTSKSATLKIYPKAELDLTQKGNELIPEGTVVTLSVDYSDYDYTGESTNVQGAVTMIDTIDADGSVSFEISTDDNGVDADVSISSFEYEQVQADGSTKTMYYSFTSKTYYSIAANSSLIKDDIVAVIVDIDESEDTYLANVTMSFYSDIDLTSIGLETIPTGTQVVITNSDKTYESTVEVVNSQIAVELPVTESGSNFTFTVMPFITTGLNNEGETITLEYSAHDVNVDYLLPGESKTVSEVTLSGTVVESYEKPELVLIGGTITADLNEKTEGYEAFGGTIFTLVNQAGTWSTPITTDNLGGYTASVPENETIFLTCDLNLNKITGEVSQITGDTIYNSESFRLVIDIDDYIYLEGVSYETGEKDFEIDSYLFEKIINVSN